MVVKQYLPYAPSTSIIRIRHSLSVELHRLKITLQLSHEGEVDPAYR